MASITCETSLLDAPFPPDQPIRAYDILRVKSPRAPVDYIPGSGKPSSSTRAPTETEFSFEHDCQLHGIIPFPPLVDLLIPILEKSLAPYPAVQPTDPWITAVHPYYTSHLLPSRISSEDDTKDWSLSLLLRPSVAVAQALAQPPPWQAKGLYPNFGSCGGTKHVPDRVLLGDDEKDIRKVVEVKKDCVLQGEGLEALREITACYKGMPLGREVKFHWPDDPNAAGLNKQTKLFVQVRILYFFLSPFILSYMLDLGADAGQECSICHVNNIFTIIFLCQKRQPPQPPLHVTGVRYRNHSSPFGHVRVYCVSTGQNQCIRACPS